MAVPRAASCTFLETQELRPSPVQFWLIWFSDTGPLRQLFFVLIMPDGTVVEPRVGEAAVIARGIRVKLERRSGQFVRQFHSSLICGGSRGDDFPVFPKYEFQFKYL